MIKGIAFDKDGTLLEYESFWIPVAEMAVNMLLHKRNLDPALASLIMEAIGAYDGISGLLCYGTYYELVEKINSVITEKTNEQPFSADEVEEKFKESIPFGRIEPTCPDIREVFAELRKRKLKIALITSDNEGLTKECIKALGIEDCFDALYTADEVHPPKPDPFYMNCFCEKFGFTPAEVIMVGDTMIDMSFAKNSGAVAVGVAKNGKNSATLKDYAYKVVYDISCVLNVIDSINKEE